MQIYHKQSFHFLLAFSVCVLIINPGWLQKSTAAKTFAVIYGSGGGFTGMANGYIIDSAGKVDKWSGLYFRRSKIEKFGTAASNALSPIQKIFSTSAYKKWKHRDMGNMTTQIWCISGKDTTRISWKGTEPGPEVPKPIRDFYGHLKLAVESAQKP